MMPDATAREPAPPSRTRRGSIALRVVIAAAVIGAAVWFIRARSSERTGGNAAAPAAGAGSPRGTGGGRGGGGEGRVVTVQVATAERTDLPIWLDGLGTVAASQQVTVRPQVDGRIDKVLFTEGQAVKRGDVLIQIDPRPFRVALHQAQGALARDRAQLEALRSNLKRYEGLQAQNLVAGQQVEEIAGQVGQFEGAIKIDQAQIENAQLQLDYAQVKAPLDGITGMRQVDAGNIVRQGDPNGLVVITAIDPAAVFFTVPQDQLSAVAQAQARGDVPVEVFSRDGATRIATGKLAVLDNQINPTTATLRLKALVPNPDRLLWPNAFVKARMLVETRKDAVVVPMVAIQRGPQGTYVYVVSPEKTAQMTPVTIALTAGDSAVIGKGLGGGEQVIVEGQNQVRPGGRVAPAPAGPGGGSSAPGAPGAAGAPDASGVPGAPGPPGAPSAPGAGEPRRRSGQAEADRPPAGPPGAQAPAAVAPGSGPRSAAPAERPASGQPADRATPSSTRGPATGPTAAAQSPAGP
jgi:membrane fusion protein, multidrug efflux system